MAKRITYRVGVGRILTGGEIKGAVNTAFQGVDLKILAESDTHESSVLRLKIHETTIHLYLEESGMTYFVKEGEDLSHFDMFFASAFGVVFIGDDHPGFKFINERLENKHRTVAIHIEVEHDVDCEDDELRASANELAEDTIRMINSHTVFNAWKGRHF